MGVTRLGRGKNGSVNSIAFNISGSGSPTLTPRWRSRRNPSPDERLGAFIPQSRIRAALNDAENQLARRARLFAAFPRPADGAPPREFLFARRSVVRRAFVECHRDVRAEHALDFHRLLRAEEQRRAIEMRAEFDAVRFDFPILARLKTWNPPLSVRIGSSQFMNAVQPTGGADDVETGPDVE